MKAKLFAIIAVTVLLLGMTGCTAGVDNPTGYVIDPEQELVGLWWDEFEYADVTEEGVPFSRVVLAVQVDANHTGCIYLGAFNDTDYYPLAVYGGPKDAGFTWRLLADGRVQLGDPVTGETYTLSRTRGDGDSYGESMTDVSSTSMTYADNSVTVTNDSYSGELEKANSEQSADIDDKLQAIITAVNSGDAGIGYSGHGDDPARTR